MADVITTLPNEILHNILRHVSVLDAHHVKLTCKALAAYVTGNWHLFFDIWGEKLDKPPKAKTDHEWEVDLQKLEVMERILGARERRYSVDEKKSFLPSVAETVQNIINSASTSPNSRNLELLGNLFDDKNNQEAFLCQSTIFQRASGLTPLQLPSIPLSTRQASAKLHCLYGVPLQSLRRSRFRRSYPYACSIVYDLRNYTDENMWGPYMEDGQATVDWERIEAVMIILDHNLKLQAEARGSFRGMWNTPFRGCNGESFLGLTPKLENGDPYNVTGTWNRIVCFLDFHDLIAYNFGSPDPGPHTPREPLDIREAIRFIVMEIKVTKISPPGPDDNPDFPVVYFKGKSRLRQGSPDPNANSMIRGRVGMTKQGEVRWTTYSIYYGEERWKSEGIQIGGLNSTRGVFGHWFDKDLSEEGPAGPTAFWKISNEIESEVNPPSPSHNGLEDDDEDDEDYNPHLGTQDDEDGEGDGDGDGEGGGDYYEVVVSEEIYNAIMNGGGLGGIGGLGANGLSALAAVWPGLRVEGGGQLGSGSGAGEGNGEGGSGSGGVENVREDEEGRDEDDEEMPELIESKE